MKFSVGSSCAIGGIAFFIELGLANKSIADLSMDVFEAARAGVLTIPFDDGDLFINNIHHFDLKDQHAVVRRVSHYQRKAQLCRTGRSISFLTGDFNYVLQGEKASRVGIDGASFPTVAHSGFHTARGKVWAPALRDTVELFQPEPTRLGTADNADGDHYFVASRIDRISTSLLPLFHTMVNIKCATVGNLASSIEACGSDHVAVGAVVSMKKRIRPEQQPMLRWIAEHELLRQEFDKLSAHIDLDGLSPFVALKAIKLLLKKAGKNAEKLAYKQDMNNPSVRMQLVLQLARALAEQDVKLLLEGDQRPPRT